MGRVSIWNIKGNRNYQKKKEIIGRKQRYIKSKWWKNQYKENEKNLDSKNNDKITEKRWFYKKYTIEDKLKIFNLFK